MTILGVACNLVGLVCGLQCMKTHRLMGFGLVVINLVLFTVMLNLALK